MKNGKLTSREIEVADLAKKGFGDQEIALYLDISLHTAKNHLKQIYKKLEVNTRAKLVALLNQKKGEQELKWFSKLLQIRQFCPFCLNSPIRSLSYSGVGATIRLAKASFYRSRISIIGFKFCSVDSGRTNQAPSVRNTTFPL